MLRRKNITVVPEGKAKEDIIDAISTWQASETIRTHEALWGLVAKSYPEVNEHLTHFNYNTLSKELSLREGKSTYYWCKFTF